MILEDYNACYYLNFYTIAFKFIYYIGMENGGNTRARRTWTTVEEEALLSILELFVLRGYRCDNGSFKSGSYTLFDKELNVKCPNSGLKTTPHIESKMKI